MKHVNNICFMFFIYIYIFLKKKRIDVQSLTRQGKKKRRKNIFRSIISVFCGAKYLARKNPELPS